MRSRHLISNTIYTTEWDALFVSTKMKFNENSFGELAKYSETPSGCMALKLLVESLAVHLSRKYLMKIEAFNWQQYPCIELTIISFIIRHAFHDIKFPFLTICSSLILIALASLYAETSHPRSRIFFLHIQEELPISARRYSDAIKTQYEDVIAGFLLVMINQRRQV